ncbi:hypothetical protein [Vallitalea guaymasensis]|uniref:hypothetical protein n=1 Tax=Vallitalea guaymasensis TaxID=1185412 RepID=UPI000DE55112|nr:hypothetical protein [Vallitalea guaymasensis]
MNKSINCINILVKYEQNRELLKKHVIKLCHSLEWSTNQIKSYLELLYGQKHLDSPDIISCEFNESNYCDEIRKKYSINNHCLLCPDSPMYKNGLEADEKVLITYALKSSKNYELLKSLGLCSSHFNSLINLNFSTNNIKLLLVPAYQILYMILDENAADFIKEIPKYLKSYTLNNTETTLFYSMYDELLKIDDLSNETIAIALLNLLDKNDCKYNETKIRKVFKLKQKKNRPKKEQLPGQLTIDNYIVKSTKEIDSNPLDAIFSNNTIGESIINSLNMEKKENNSAPAPNASNVAEPTPTKPISTKNKKESLPEKPIGKKTQEPTKPIPTSDEEKEDISGEEQLVENKIDYNFFDERESNKINNLLDFKAIDMMLIKSTLISIEYNKNLDCIVLFLDNTYFHIQLDNYTVMDEFMYYLLDKDYTKISFFGHELISVLRSRNIKIENLFSINTAYSVVNYAQKYKEPKEIIKELTGTSNEDNVTIYKLMKYYCSTYKYFNKTLSLNLWYRLFDEYFYNYLLGCSYHYNKLFNINKRSFIPTCHFRYAFLYTNQALNQKGIIIKAQYSNINGNKDTLVLGYSLDNQKGVMSYIYRAICIELVKKHAIDKYQIMLLKLSSEGLIFFSSNNCYKVLFDLLNRLMINISNKYFPLITPNIIIELKEEQ